MRTYKDLDTDKKVLVPLDTIHEPARARHLVLREVLAHAASEESFGVKSRVPLTATGAAGKAGFAAFNKQGNQ